MAGIHADRNQNCDSPDLYTLTNYPSKYMLKDIFIVYDRKHKVPFFAKKMSRKYFQEHIPLLALRRQWENNRTFILTQCIKTLETMCANHPGLRAGGRVGGRSVAVVDMPAFSSTECQHQA